MRSYSGPGTEPGECSEGERRRSPKLTNTALSAVFHFFNSLSRDAWAEFRSWPLWKKLVVIGGLIGVALITIVMELPSIITLRNWAGESGSAFVWFFCALYVVVTQFPIPRTFLTLASGLLFGPWLGTAVALGSTTVSAAISLLIVRGLLGDWMAPRLTHPAVSRINIRLEQRGWLAITSLRMIAAVPFSILNYVAALTSVPLVAFTVATAIGSAPGTVATVVLGNAFVDSGSLTAVSITLLLAGLGVLGIILDQRLPVKSGK